jgi:hypothetical protein
MRHRHREPPGREADSLLCGDIRTGQGASIVRRPVGEKVIADHDTESE